MAKTTYTLIAGRPQVVTAYLKVLVAQNYKFTCTPHTESTRAVIETSSDAPKPVGGVWSAQPGDVIGANVSRLPRLCTSVRCTLPGDHTGICEERDEIQAIYDEARDTQTAFWLALRRLEVAIGFDVDQDADLELSSIDDLREENESECAK